MITLSEEKPCIDAEVIEDLHATYEALQDEPKNTLEHTLEYYIAKQYEFDEKLRKECPFNDAIPSEVTEVSPEAQVM